MNKPFLLSPAGKDYLWGGERLKVEYGKKLPLTPLAESWECSTHPDGLSVAASGEYAGMTLKDILTEHPEYVGTHPDVRVDMPGELPILVKLIDAGADLSVQVHPDDDYAYSNENGSRGKTEAWYVLDADDGASLVYGLNRDTDRETVKKAIEDKCIEEYLLSVPVRKNDVFYIEAGTIHAIGAGVLIAEIQENSNITYRLYDYDRRDKYGNTRPLHIDKALDTAILKRLPEPVQPMRVLKYRPGIARELLCRCRYFEVHRMLVNTLSDNGVTSVDYKADELSFRVLLCIDGAGDIGYAAPCDADEGIKVSKGDCVFVPADSVILNIRGKLQFLDICG